MKKAIVCVFLLSCGLAVCEVPPPYLQQGFRPSPQYNYRPQIQKITAVNVEIPTRLTLEQLIRLTEQLQDSRGKYQTLPQDSYFPPSRAPQQTLQFNRPITDRYVPPVKLQNTYGAPNLQQLGSSGNQLRPPSTSYGVPDSRNIETFENLLNDLNRQRLPNKSPTGFNKPQQYLPPNIANAGQQEQSITPSPPNSYLPPQSTTPAVTASTTVAPATTAATVEGPKNFDYDYDLQPSTENPLNQGASEAGPNISISNAVAGPGGFFYLQQPDGRLQKVVLEKTQEPNSKPEEHIAKYYFQNIQALPNTVYAPLISLGSYNKK